MKFSVRAGDREYRIRFDEDYGKRTLIVDGEPYDINLLRVEGARVRFTLNNRPVEAVINTTDTRGLLSVDAGSGRVDLEIEEARYAQVKKISGLTQVQAAMRELKAPMPGLITQILVQPGDEVSAGTPILVMEAMKMENELRSTGKGVVLRVNAEPQEAVEQGKVLVTFVPPAEAGQ